MLEQIDFSPEESRMMAIEGGEFELDGPLKSSNLGGGAVSNGNGVDRMKIMSPEKYIGSAAKHLVIKPGSLTPKPKFRLLLTDGEETTGDNNDGMTPPVLQK